jgi:hypothetical protein
MRRLRRRALASALMAGLCIPVLTASPVAATHGATTQKLRPNGFDANADNWTEVTAGGQDVMFDEVDDITGDGDNTKVTSPTVNGSDATKYMKVNLGSAEVPEAGEFDLVYRARKSTGDGGSAADVRPDIEIYQGATLIKDFSNLPNLGTTFDVNTVGWNTQAANVTDWTDLELRFGADATSSGVAKAVHITQAYLEIPPPPEDDGCTTQPGTDGTTSVSGGGTALETELVTQTGPRTFCIAAGTYTAPVGGLSLQDNDVLNGEDQADPIRGLRPLVEIEPLNSDVKQIMDGAGGIDNVTVLDIAVDGGEDQPDPDADDEEKNPLPEGDDGDCTTNEGPGDQDNDDCGAGIEPGHDWVVRRSRVFESETSGIKSPGEDFYMWNTELDTNGQKYNTYDDDDAETLDVDNNGASAAIKGGSSGAFSVEYSFIHDNNQGIWCDVDCENNNDTDPTVTSGFFVQDNILEDHCSYGIHYENTYEDTGTDAEANIAFNRVTGSDACDIDARKSDIGVVDAIDANVHDNHIGDHTDTSYTPDWPFDWDAGPPETVTHSSDATDNGFIALNGGRGDPTDTVFHGDNHLGGNGDEADCQDTAVCERETIAG